MITLGHHLRSTGMLVVLAAANAGCWRWCGDDRARAFHAGAELTALLSGLAALTLQVALAWLLLVATLLVLEPLAGRDLSRTAGCPPALRRALLTLCGLAVAGALAAPAQAGGDHRTNPATLDGLPLPDRTTGTVHRDAPSPGRVTVRRGDTLWSIAAADLPAHAVDAQVDATWRALYAANRDRVGPDPDLIRPGTALRLTEPLEEDR
jgi:nucleoid-associated protein YgaU